MAGDLGFPVASLCVTETKKVSVLSYKNLKSSFSKWLTHLTLRFLYILGCSGSQCGGPEYAAVAVHCTIGGGELWIGPKFLVHANKNFWTYLLDVWNFLQYKNKFESTLLRYLRLKEVEKWKIGNLFMKKMLDAIFKINFQLCYGHFSTKNG